MTSPIMTKGFLHSTLAALAAGQDPRAEGNYVTFAKLEMALWIIHNLGLAEDIAEDDWRYYSVHLPEIGQVKFWTDRGRFCVSVGVFRGSIGEGYVRAEGCEEAVMMWLRRTT